MPVLRPQFTHCTLRITNGLEIALIAVITIPHAEQILYSPAQRNGAIRRACAWPDFGVVRAATG